MNALKNPFLAILGGMLLLLMSSCAGGSPDYGRYTYDDTYYFTYPYPYSYGEPYFSGYWGGDGYWWHGDHWAHGSPQTHGKPHVDHAHKKPSHEKAHDSGQSQGGEHT